MKLMELYNQIENPINDSNVFKRLIEVYSLSGDLYSGLQYSFVKRTKGKWNDADSDYFYSMMFNKWKNSIVLLTEEKFRELNKTGSYGNDFIKMRKFLKTIPDVKTEKEANDIFFGKYNDEELRGALKKYRWTAFGEGNGNFVHVCSRYVTAKQDKYPHVEHRLYLNTDSSVTFKMINLFVKKCDEWQIPYYFKFDPYGDRADTIVIYSSTENLTKYIDILQEIKKIHPDLVSMTNEPPILTGKIDNWIGYGAEPSRDSNGKKHSYNEIRAKIVESAICSVTKKWIIDHKNDKVTYNTKYPGRTFLYKEYLAMKVTEKVIDNLEKKFIHFVRNKDKLPERYGRIKNENDVINFLGYSLDDLKSPTFIETIYKHLCSQMDIVLSNMYKTDYTEPIKFNVRNGKQIRVSYNDFERVIKEQSVKILKRHPNFEKDIRFAIGENAKKYGIDVDKFCFDVKTRDKIRTITAQREAQKQQVQQQLSTPQRRILTSGAKDPNASMGASGENYFEMKNKIKNLGNMKEILNNHDLVKSVIAYNGDRHFFKAFIDLVNEGLAKHEIMFDDLEVFTSGEVVDAIVNIEQTAKKYGNRQAYPSEAWDKLNYLAMITDSNAYAASFTHPEIMKAMAGNANRDLSQWSHSAHVPPVGGFAVVVSELLESKNIEAAKEYIKEIGYYDLKYVTDSKKNGFSLANNSDKEKILSDGASNGNYFEMKNKINSLGSMKEILNNHDLVKSIIAYNGDRHFFLAFIDLINEGLAKHEITSDDLEVFTSGEVADAIVNIEQTAKKYGNRQAYPSEAWDKLNYLALITDSKAYAASFTHPEIMKAMAGNANRDLSQWSHSAHVPPVGGFAAVIYEMIEKGNIEEAKEFIDRIGRNSKKYSQAHKMQSVEELKQEDIREQTIKTKQYLEELLLREMQEKYNYDIEQQQSVGRHKR